MAKGPEAGMRVDFTRLLSLTAHEIRGPVSVIQGYVRLMMRQHGDGHPDAPMLKAMMDATARLSALGRDASELGQWIAPTSGRVETLTAADLVTHINARTAAAPLAITVVDEAGIVALKTPNAGVLAAAIVALAESVSRDAGARTVLTVSQAADGGCAIDLEPEANLNFPLPDHAEGRAVAFDRGGLGLALALASYVLEAHHARVDTGAAPGSVRVRFGPEGRHA